MSVAVNAEVYAFECAEEHYISIYELGRNYDIMSKRADLIKTYNYIIKKKLNLI